MNEEIDLFIEKWLDFSGKIRGKDGLDEDLYDDLVELLQSIQSKLIGKDLIPKSLAEIFVDIWGALTSSADMYDDDARQRIYEAADHLTGYARDICTS